MAKRRKTWAYGPDKAPKAKVPENVKQDLEEKAEVLVQTVLKPRHIKPPPEDQTPFVWNGHCVGQPALAGSRSATVFARLVSVESAQR